MQANIKPGLIFWSFGLLDSGLGASAIQVRPAL